MAVLGRGKLFFVNLRFHAAVLRFNFISPVLHFRGQGYTAKLKTANIEGLAMNAHLFDSGGRHPGWQADPYVIMTLVRPRRGREETATLCLHLVAEAPAPAPRPARQG
ncbi:hypothetical protein V5799_015151 [Amblyomma americanum]|uniref:Uncharacterized protein n=1 Tax=Amblyomma americanum TaxID=6943 RepID=A0AAQ4E0Z5_AMBAM